LPPGRPVKDLQNNPYYEGKEERGIKGKTVFRRKKRRVKEKKIRA